MGGEKYLRLTCKTHATGRPAVIDVLVRESLFAAPVTEKMRVKITGWLIAGEMELIDAVPAQLRDFPEKTTWLLKASRIRACGADYA